MDYMSTEPVAQAVFLLKHGLTHRETHIHNHRHNSSPYSCLR